MKNEILMRAIGEIDDEFLTEARLPIRKPHRSFKVMTRYAAAAACFVFLIAAVLFLRQPGDDFVLSINGTELTQLSDTAEIPLLSMLHQRSFPGSEIPLHVSCGGKEVILTADDGGMLSDESGASSRTLTLKADTDIVWTVDVTAQNSFTLTICEGRQTRTLRLIADVSADGNTLIVTVSED